MTATPIEAPHPDQPEDPTIDQRLARSQAVIESLRVSLANASEETVLIRADLSMARAEIDSLGRMLGQVNAEVLRLKSLYEPDSLTEVDVHVHDGEPHTH
jgi:hypothetical protein